MCRYLLAKILQSIYAKADQLQIDTGRILFPPVKNHWWQVNWRQRFVFEFLIPAPEALYNWRYQRKLRGSHDIDSHLTPQLVEQQITLFKALAHYFAQQGMPVYQQESVHAAPTLIR